VGLAAFEAPTWFPVFLPRGASEPIFRKLNQAAFATADTPSVLQETLNVQPLLFTEELILAVDLRQACVAAWTADFGQQGESGLQGIGGKIVHPQCRAVRPGAHR
jgi:hypothetical protein